MRQKVAGTLARPEGQVKPASTNQIPRIKSQEPNPKNQIPRTKSQEPNPKDQIPRTKSQEPNPKNQIPRTKSQEPNPKIQNMCWLIGIWFLGFVPWSSSL